MAGAGNGTLNCDVVWQAQHQCDIWWQAQSMEASWERWSVALGGWCREWYVACTLQCDVVWQAQHQCDIWCQVIEASW